MCSKLKALQPASSFVWLTACHANCFHVNAVMLTAPLALTVRSQSVLHRSDCSTCQTDLMDSLTASRTYFAQWFLF